MTGLSVVIPFFNEIDLIKNAVNSVHISLVSEIQEVEIIVVNDGSISNEIIRYALSCFSSLEINILNNTYPQGPGGARNTGLDHARHSLISFLDADDVWLVNKLQDQLKVIKSGATFVCSNYYIDEVCNTVFAPKEITSSLDIFRYGGIGTSTVLISKKLLGSTRFSDLRYAQDIDFWYRLSKKSGFKFGSTNTVAVRYSSGGSTRNKFVQLLYLDRVLSKNSINISARMEVLVRYSLRGLRHHYYKAVKGRLAKAKEDK